MSQWELLVTDGHVRAARWRAGAKFITGIGATLIILGFIGIWLTPQNNPVSRIAQAKQELVNARQNALTKFMAGKGAPPRPLPANAANATAMNNAESLIAGLLESLNRNNTLPPEIKSIDPETFWTGNWTPGAVAAVTSGRTILIGFYVTPPRPAGQAQAPPPVLGRMFGLFRRAPDKQDWSFYCLTVPQAAPCRGEPVLPAAIPATLRELTPASAREP